MELHPNLAMSGLPKVDPRTTKKVNQLHRLDNLGLPASPREVAWGVTEKRGVSQDTQPLSRLDSINGIPPLLTIF